MPDISLANLAGIPGVNQAAMTQPNPNDCGAYALTGAVGAFAVFPMDANLGYANAGPQPVNNAGAVAQADGYAAISAAVYGITGVLNPPAAPPVVPELTTVGNAYNSPAALAQVALDLGRHAPRINAQAAGFANLGALYPGARGRCEAVVGVEHVSVTAGPYSPPYDEFAHVVCVSVAGGGLHWVAQGSDRNFYDPADGSLNNAWGPLHTGDAMGPYAFAGLWLVIR